MKWSILIGVPAVVAGLLLLREATGPGVKPGPVIPENSRDITVVNPCSLSGSAEVSSREQLVFRPETEIDNSLLFKNILVCIP